MATKFKATYLDKQGHKHQKIIQAESEALAYKSLTDIGFSPTDIKPLRKKSSSSLFAPKVKSTDIETLTTNLASLLGNGVNLDKALGLLMKSADNEQVEELLQSLQISVRGGAALSSALKKHPKHFDELYIKLVELGEATGTIGEVMKGLSEQLKFKNQMQNQIKQAMSYPMVIVFVCIASLAFILKVVVPQLSSMLDGSKELPVYTEALLVASNWINSSYGLISLAVIAALVAMLFTSSQAFAKAFRSRLLKVWLKAPLIKGLHTLAEQSRFTSAMYVSLRSGLNLTSAMKLASNTLSSLSHRARVQMASKVIQGGERFSNAIEEANVLESMDIGYLEIGEETGDLAGAFDEVRTRKIEQFNLKLNSLLKILEPMLILVMGVLVGGVVIIMMLSILSVQDVTL
ncbi:type II secretion system F family protein [Pseudoalteromonas ruthenica]|uniref:Type II secretion system protein GspF domain-containing protein n=1 Tax=Pseudoalteromonas ruthenica TaxID=151081 RepID=A0A0F4PUG4_9GAMM|nr:type II secretion system F family protein [Pseudoalteromonas ruthenica]KJY95002.1 hypothetical protein TW76_16205 [Pseudoalteromonas ruthenica]KJY98683.1 hypothetical protein TW72_13250 [Pseudoalteromonas ruthenica]TMO86976.1 type II secretion system F family protein [Pseudoalteromonas ruthenica]TMO93764.1 type II secretion system F family protein [Pseudoalteromonas ruthenica]TMO97486.1 type II secretion system F family protein [Pseudoalteromonas ruthenica]|tara:strand:+ start:23731 stop:24942 length:1212 start_codon:yes stop_codon:yes gene_type:complete